MELPDASVIDGLLGIILDAAYDFLVGLMSFLDVDPFPEMIASMPVSDGLGQFGALLNWILPVADIVTILNVWLGMMFFAWFVMFCWRLIRWVE